MKAGYRFFTIIMCILISVGLAWSLSQSDTKKENIISHLDANSKVNTPYDSIFKNEIPIIASYPIPEGRTPTKEAFKAIKECGFSIISYALSAKNIDRAVELSKECNISLIVRTGKLLQPDGREILVKYRNTNEIIGWYLRDEPLYDELDTLKFYYERIRKSNPEKLVYFNLIGDNIKKYIGPSNGYTDYLNHINQQFHPMLWSYDCYPIAEDKGNIKVSYDLFYSNLETFRMVSTKTQTPFWAYCQSMEYRNKKVYRPKCTIPFLRFEAFSALAYGAQGIVYWAYAQQNTNKGDVFLSAPINLAGERTKEWYDVKSVNSEIAAFSKIFKNANVIDCQHTGDRLIKDTKKYNGAFWPLSHCTSGKLGILISLIHSSDDYYLVIVNHDVENDQNISLRFQDNIKGGELVFQGDGMGIIQHRFSHQFNKKLTPGGYAILKINQ